MLIENRLIAYTLLALLVALVVSFLMTPIVKTFAYKVGAIDVPKDARRMRATELLDGDAGDLNDTEDEFCGEDW